LEGFRDLSVEKLDDIAGAVNVGQQVVDQAKAGWLQPPSPPPVTGSVTGGAPAEGPIINPLQVGVDAQGLASSGLALGAVALAFRKGMRRIIKWWNQEEDGHGN